MDPRTVPTSFHCASCEREREIELHHDHGCCARCVANRAASDGEAALAGDIADDHDLELRGGEYLTHYDAAAYDHRAAVRADQAACTRESLARLVRTRAELRATGLELARRYARAS